jgi:glycoside/pentoside/hexuronide:cation symporter, GPH family
MENHTEAGRLPIRTLIAYSLPAAPIAAMGLPLAVYLPPFYAGYMGFGLATIGGIFLLIRLFDVAVDPVLGIISDRFPSRWGRRRHWIALSVPIMLLATYMVFFPEKGVGSTYLISWMLVLYFGWSLLTLSHVAWGAELSSEYHARSQIQGWRQAILVAGLVLVLLMPTLAQLLKPEHIEPARIAAMGAFVLVTLPLAILWTLSSVPEHPTPERPHLAWGKALGVLLKNRPLQIVLAIDLVGGAGASMVASMFLFLCQDVLKLGPLFSSTMLLVYFTSGIVFVGPILMLSRRIGKHRTAMIAALWTAVFHPMIWLLPEKAEALTLFLFVILGANYAAGPFLLQSMMADVAEQDMVETRQSRTGFFFSLLTMTQKLGQAGAIYIGYNLLAWVNFHPGAQNTDAAILGFKIVYVIPLTVVVVLCGVLFWFFPLDEEQQRRNRAVLAARARGGAMVADAVGEAWAAAGSGE